MSGNRMSYGGDIDFGPSHVSKKGARPLGGKPRGLRAKGRVFLHGYAIVQQRGRSDHLAMASLFVQDANGVMEYSQDMSGIVRAVIAFAGKREQLRGEVLVRGKGSAKPQGYAVDSRPSRCCVSASWPEPGRFAARLR